LRNGSRTIAKAGDRAGGRDAAPVWASAAALEAERPANRHSFSEGDEARSSVKATHVTPNDLAMGLAALSNLRRKSFAEFLRVRCESS